MWDITGKYFKTPVYNLLGGKMRDKVKIYVNGWFVGAREPDEFAAKAKATAALGINAMKWDPFGTAYMTISNKELDKAVRCVGAVCGMRSVPMSICLSNATDASTPPQRYRFPAS